MLPAKPARSLRKRWRRILPPKEKPVGTRFRLRPDLSNATEEANNMAQHAKAMASAKAMGMFLQDPMLSDLHEDYPFPLDRDFLLGAGSSRFLIRDSSESDIPLYAGLDWGQEKD